MRRLLRQDSDQFGHMFADGTLPVFIAGCRKPNRPAIGQRAKAGIEMIKARIDKFDRDNKTTEHLRNSAMRLDIGPKLVPAKKCVAVEESVAFTFEVEIVGQPRDLVAMFFHPARKMRRFA